MKKTARVRDVMSAPVFRLRADEELIVASKVMNWGKIRHVPVVDEDEHVVGMVTQRDLLKYAISLWDYGPATPEGAHPMWGIPIERVMFHPVQTIEADEPIQEAAYLMRKTRVGCLPVVEDGVLVGIVAEYDLLELVEKAATVARP